MAGGGKSKSAILSFGGKIVTPVDRGGSGRSFGNRPELGAIQVVKLPTPDHLKRDIVDFGRSNTAEFS